MCSLNCLPPALHCPLSFFSLVVMQFEDADDISDALLIQGMWAASEAVAEDGEEQENGDVLLEELDPRQVSHVAL